MRKLTIAVLLFSPVLVASAGAQKKTAASYTPVTATFRCPLELDCTGTDGVSGDGLGPYTGSAAGTQGPTLNSGGDLYFPLRGGGGRFISIDFGTPLSTPACSASATCRRDFDAVSTDTSQPGSITNPVAANGTELPDGFRSIAVGQSVRARYKLNFNDPSGRPLLWTVRFNSAVYAGSTDVTVTRTADNAWVVEASAEDVAELVSTPTSGRPVTVSEGFYSMPFRIHVVR